MESLLLVLPERGGKFVSITDERGREWLPRPTECGLEFGWGWVDRGHQRIHEHHSWVKDIPCVWGGIEINYRAFAPSSRTLFWPPILKSARAKALE
jgi:hypothetical protein